MLARPALNVAPTLDEMLVAFATMRIADGVRSALTTLGGWRAVLVAADRPATPGTILYFHGGSGVLGSPETAMSLTAAVVSRTAVRSILVVPSGGKSGPPHGSVTTVVDDRSRPG